MDLNSSTDHCDLHQQVKAIDDLIEEWWFFGNMLNTKPSRVLRHCHSDPYPSCFSTSSNSETPESRNFVSSKNLEASEKHPLIQRCIGRKEDKNCEGEVKKTSNLRRQLSEKVRVQEQNSDYLQIVGEKGGGSSRRKKSQSSKGNLQRTRTLPSYIGREDLDDELEDDQESDVRLGFLIREALASSSEMTHTPPRQTLPKVSIIPRNKPPRSSRSTEEPIHEMTRSNQNQETLRKTLSNIETGEIKWLRDLEIRFNKKQDLNLRYEIHEESKIHCAAAGAPIPTWVQKESTRDMKTQIKFWARAVASNVRQEC